MPGLYQVSVALALLALALADVEEVAEHLERPILDLLGFRALGLTGLAPLERATDAVLGSGPVGTGLLDVLGLTEHLGGIGELRLDLLTLLRSGGLGTHHVRRAAPGDEPGLLGLGLLGLGRNHGQADLGGGLTFPHLLVDRDHVLRSRRLRLPVLDRSASLHVFDQHEVESRTLVVHVADHDPDERVHREVVARTAAQHALVHDTSRQSRTDAHEHAEGRVGGHLAIELLAGLDVRQEHGLGVRRPDEEAIRLAVLTRLAVQPRDPDVDHVTHVVVRVDVLPTQQGVTSVIHDAGEHPERRVSRTNHGLELLRDLELRVLNRDLRPLEPLEIERLGHVLPRLPTQGRHDRGELDEGPLLDRVSVHAPLAQQMRAEVLPRERAGGLDVLQLLHERLGLRGVQVGLEPQAAAAPAARSAVRVLIEGLGVRQRLRHPGARGPTLTGPTIGRVLEGLADRPVAVPDLVRVLRATGVDGLVTREEPALEPVHPADAAVERLEARQRQLVRTAGEVTRVGLVERIAAVLRLHRADDVRVNALVGPVTRLVLALRIALVRLRRGRRRLLLALLVVAHGSLLGVVGVADSGQSGQNGKNHRTLQGHRCVHTCTLNCLELKMRRCTSEIDS